VNAGAFDERPPRCRIERSIVGRGVGHGRREEMVELELLGTLNEKRPGDQWFTGA
jgi:hypothetical protein